MHIDGEFFATPDDQIRSLEIQIRPGALRVLTPGLSELNGVRASDSL